jgi:hypothetical protein
MKALLLCNLLWAALLAVLWSPDKTSGTIDFLIAAACYIWVLSLIALFFRARWAWWGSVAASAAITLFMSHGVLLGLIRDSSGTPGWPGWPVMLGFFVPTLAALLSLIFARRFLVGDAS